jgi:hypothetical protein
MFEIDPGYRWMQLDEERIRLTPKAAYALRSAWSVFAHSHGRRDVITRDLSCTYPPDDRANLVVPQARFTLRVIEQLAPPKPDVGSGRVTTWSSDVQAVLKASAQAAMASGIRNIRTENALQLFPLHFIGGIATIPGTEAFERLKALGVDMEMLAQVCQTRWVTRSDRGYV